MVKALYKINEQRKLYFKQRQDCVSKFNQQQESHKKELADIDKNLDLLGVKIDEYQSHNLDLQEGLLGSLKKQEVQEVELAKLKAKRVRRVALGGYGGYDVFNSIWSGGFSLNYNFLYLF